jgi:hypothetical protein
MKHTFRQSRTVGALLLAVAAAGCGVGNDQDAGSLTAFNVQPSSFTVAGPDSNTCGSGETRVYAFGGDGPYVVKNSGAPFGVTVSRTSLDRSGDFFIASWTDAGLCGSAVVVVVDQKGRQAVFTLNSERGEDTQ